MQLLLFKLITVVQDELKRQKKAIVRNNVVKNDKMKGKKVKNIFLEPAWFPLIFNISDIKIEFKMGIECIVLVSMLMIW